jgi:hypothetical protein
VQVGLNISLRYIFNPSYSPHCINTNVVSKLKPAAQTAHLVFADTKANAEKTKRAVFCQRTK